MKTHTLLAIFISLLITGIVSAKASSHSFMKHISAGSSFDIVILNGRAMDPETNFDGVRNVGFKDGHIGCKP